jgi:hypothetical protein
MVQWTDRTRRSLFLLFVFACFELVLFPLKLDSPAAGSSLHWTVVLAPAIISCLWCLVGVMEVIYADIYTVPPRPKPVRCL